MTSNFPRARLDRTLHLSSLTDILIRLCTSHRYPNFFLPWALLQVSSSLFNIETFPPLGTFTCLGSNPSYLNFPPLPFWQDFSTTLFISNIIWTFPPLAILEISSDLIIIWTVPPWHFDKTLHPSSIPKVSPWHFDKTLPSPIIINTSSPWRLDKTLHLSSLSKLNHARFDQGLHSSSLSDTLTILCISQHYVSFPYPSLSQASLPLIIIFTPLGTLARPFISHQYLYFLLLFALTRSWFDQNANINCI